LSSGISVACIIGGLPWGAIGVAAAYAASELCFVTPIVFWSVSRRGPVRFGDFFKTIAPGACASLCTLSVLIISRPWLQSFHLAWRLVLAFATTAIVSAGVLAALPTGRAAMQSSKEMFLLLIRGRRDAILP